jgi:glycosyltransferase involved in cell wall biosynthesis
VDTPDSSTRSTAVAPDSSTRSTAVAPELAAPGPSAPLAPGVPAPAAPVVPVGAPSRPLRIGIDARAAMEVPAGRGRVVRELLRALAARSGGTSGEANGRPEGGREHQYILYAREAWAEDSLDERFQWRLLDARDPWWHWRAAREANGECDVFLSCNSYLTVAFLRIPCVPIVHDLMTFEQGMHAKRTSRVVERLTLGVAARRSAKLLAVSQATAEALIGRFPGTASRTVVAPLGIAPALTEADTAEAAALPPPGFVLAVGTLEPRKNLPRLVEAYAAMAPELQAAHPLVVVGALGWDTNGTLQALQSLGERCTMLGYVSDAALAELYRRCAVFCYPSLGEGFGLPVLEAMAAGATVLTSAVSSLPEVGGDAVAYADPTEAKAISEQLQRLLRDDALRAELAMRGRTRASRFSWDAFAQTVLGTLEAAATATPPAA